MERLRDMAPTVAIGHPRFRGKDGSGHSDVLGMDGRKLSEWLAQSGRPTILYCPTWGDLTSFEWFRKGMNGLLAKYRVIVKLELADAVNRLLGQPIPDFGKLNERLYAYQDGLAPQRAHAAISQLPAGDGGPKRKNDYPGRFLAEATASFIETFKDRPFMVWGAGSYVQLIIPWLKKAGIRIKAIMDKSPDRVGKELCGIRIRPPESVRFEPGDKCIVAFIPQAAEEIASLMRTKGVADEDWFLPFQM